MQLARIKISNILAVEALEWKPGPFTRITGSNGVGKTTVLEAIKSICKGGHDATLLRKGQKKGEVVLEFADGHTVAKRVTESGSYLDITDPNGAKVRKPAEFLGKLWDSLSANPVAFIAGSTKQRIDWLLDALDDEAALEGLDAILDSRAVRGMSGIATIERARKEIYEHRANHNRDAKKARETADALESDLPEIPENIAKDLRSAETHLDLRRRKLDEDCSEAMRKAALESKQVDSNAEGLLAALDQQIEDLRNQFEAELANLQTKRSQIRADREARNTTIKDRAIGVVQETRRGAEPELDELKARVSTLQERKASAAAAAERRSLAARNRAEAEESERHSQACTDALERIGQLKRDLLSRLPIEGVDVDPELGTLTVDGIPFERLNTARQWGLAITLAKHRAGEVGIVCADGLELLDDANFESFREMAVESGLHFIVTDRGNGPLAITEEGR